MTAAAAVADQSTFEHENEPLKKRSEREFCKEEEGGRLLLALPHSLALTLNPDDCHSLSRFVVVCLSVRLAVVQVIRVSPPWHHFLNRINVKRSQILSNSALSPSVNSV